ncbi:MAG: DUF1315 family protein [Cellvibrionaceae bacterium]
MSIEKLIENLDADIYRRLKTAVEIGKWPNGEPLNADQRASSMQAVILYENRHLPAEQRTGYVERPKTTACNHKEGEKVEAFDDTPLRWK